MPNRILRDWTDSYAVNELDAHEERFFVRLIMKADDYGRFHADPRLLKANLFPLLPGIRDTDISRWLAACEKAGLLRCYVDARGRQFLVIQNFQQRKRQKTASKFPAPPDSQSQNARSPADAQMADRSPPRDGRATDARQSQRGLSPARATKPQNDSHATATRRLEAYSEAEAEATRERASGGGNGGATPFDCFDDPLAEMAQAVSVAMGLPSTPEGDAAAPIHEAAEAFVAAGCAPSDVPAYERDYYRRKAAQGSNYPLTLKILRQDLPGWVRARRMRQAAGSADFAPTPAPRPPVVTAPPDYRKPKPQNTEDTCENAT